MIDGQKIIIYFLLIVEFYFYFGDHLCLLSRTMSGDVNGIKNVQTTVYYMAFMETLKCLRAHKD